MRAGKIAAVITLTWATVSPRQVVTVALAGGPIQVKPTARICRLPVAARPAEPVPVADALAWPAVTAECRPWTRWWWLGSAVDKENVTRLLGQYRQAGLGGVEICPIYGAKGFEDGYLKFLSPAWMSMLAHTTAEAKRLRLGVDLTTGTGWPFGGPGVSVQEASSRVLLKSYEVAGGGILKDRLPRGRLQCLMAVSGKAKAIDLTARVKDGRLDWTAPPGRWRLYAVVQSGPVQKVKRAAPGGEGYVVDPYSVTALKKYLAGFDKALAEYHGAMPRSHFHDSFEYYGATWTSDFFAEFQKRRGYDMRTQLPALFGQGPADTVARVKCDYRETIADLHLAYIAAWTEWCHGHHSRSRNQAHGAPGNLLDLYAAADIPETEIFRSVDERQIPMAKMASAAAHLTGRKLASAESFTWLGEHFQVALADLKPAADFLFLAGINHLFFHGIPYSPKEAAWPGWQFYAAVNFGPEGGLWHDLPEFNAYVARCQSILQAGRPVNDVLLYFPVHDLWQQKDGLLIPCTVPGKWMWSQPIHATAMTLWKRGYGFDEVSDRLLAQAKATVDGVLLGDFTYRVVLVPPCRLMPAATLHRLVELARAGATVIMQEALPSDVPGLGDLEKRRGEFRTILQSISLKGDGNGGTRQAKVGQGRFLVGTDLEAMLRRAKVPREAVVDAGIQLVRRSHPHGLHYFLVNRNDRALDGWVTLGTAAQAAVIMDPRFPDRTGVAKVRPGGNGVAQVYLQLKPGESCVVRTSTDRKIEGRPWRYWEKAGEPKIVAGEWKVVFVEGGPVLPAPFETRKLASWTAQDDAEAKRFAGTARYITEFDHPGGDAKDWLLDLGRVCESARVRVNGKAIGTLWCPPFEVAVGEHLRRGRNTLEVEITNLAANRIADLDRRHVRWKYFHEINFVNINYKPFDASKWPLRDSGLLGPVRLIPVTESAIARERNR
jgi:hypothetical protein